MQDLYYYSNKKEDIYESYAFFVYRAMRNYIKCNFIR